jgi:DedD protein
MEQKLKQRLIGAIILVSLAVIFIPIILEGPDDEWSPRSNNIPEPPRMDYGTDMELALPPVETAETVEDEPMEPMEPMESTEPEKPVAAPAVEQQVDRRPAEPEKTALPPAQPATPPPAAVEKTDSPLVPPPGWYVQVGSFSQKMNAEGLRDRLQAAGHKTRLQAINIGKAQVYRVLVGPADSRASAEQQSSRLVTQQKIKGIIIEYPG